jgi:hypothetical protein
MPTANTLRISNQCLSGKDQNPIRLRGVFGDSIKQGRWSHFVTTSSSIIVPN